MSDQAQVKGRKSWAALPERVTGPCFPPIFSCYKENYLNTLMLRLCLVFC